MTFIRSHLGLILPLFAILFALEYLFIFERVVKTYEIRLQTQYTIVVVADKKVKPVTLRNTSVLVSSVEKVDATHILKRLRRQVSKEDLEKINAVLPNFYLLKLRRYPDKKSLEQLKNDLLAVTGVKKVQIFEKVHDRLYEMLSFMKNNYYIFAALIGSIGFLLVMKQMAIWQFEHGERMRIMALFGAPVWLRSGMLFRLAIVDAFLALLGVVVTIFAFMSNGRVQNILSEMGMEDLILFEMNDFLWLASVGFGIALFSAFWVVLRFEEEL